MQVLCIPLHTSYIDNSVTGTGLRPQYVYDYSTLVKTSGVPSAPVGQIVVLL